MTARIYTAAEAEAIVSACRGQRDTWRQIAESDPTFRVDAEYRARIGREESLAASVAFHARRAEKAEADLTVADDRASDAEAESAAAEAALVAVWQAVTDDDLPRLPSGDGTVVDAEAVGRRVAAVRKEVDAMANRSEYLDRRVESMASAISSLVIGVLDAIGARDRAVPNLPFAILAEWLATETRLVVDRLTMARDNHHARAERAEDALRAKVTNASAVDASGRAVMAEGVERMEVMRAELDAAMTDATKLLASRDYLVRQVEHDTAALQRAWREGGNEGSAPNADAAVDALLARTQHAEAERDALRAIVEGRTTPPTDAEIAAHGGPGCSGWWLVSAPDDMSLELIEQPQERDWCIQWGATQWLPIDLDGRPCAWPIVTEVTP